MDDRLWTLIMVIILVIAILWTGQNSKNRDYELDKRILKIEENLSK